MIYYFKTTQAHVEGVKPWRAAFRLKTDSSNGSNSSKGSDEFDAVNGSAFDDSECGEASCFPPRTRAECATRPAVANGQTPHVLVGGGRSFPHHLEGSYGRGGRTSSAAAVAAAAECGSVGLASLRRLGLASLDLQALVSVDLTNRGVTAADARAMAPFLAASPRLTHLKLGYNCLGDAGVVCLANALSSPSVCLQMLDLGFNQIGDAGAAALGATLATNRSLATLYLSANCMGPLGATSLAEGLRTNSSLVVLHMTGNSLKAEGCMAFGAVLQENRTLLKLYMSGSAIGAAGAKSLAQALVASATPLPVTDTQPTNNFLTVETAPLGTAPTDDGSDMAVVDSNQPSKSASSTAVDMPIDSQSTSSRDGSGRSQSDENGTGTTSSGSGGSGSGATSAWVPRSGSSPPVVNCSGLSNPRLTEAEVNAARCNGRNSPTGPGGLEWLYISQNHIGDEGLVAVADAMTRHRRLRTLELGFNGITHKGCDALCRSLWHYTTLLYLHLDNNGIGCRGAQHLAVVLPSTRLKLLDVGFNGLGAPGVTSLMAAVAMHPTLQVLTLSGNRLDLEGGHAIAKALGKSAGLLEVYLDHTELSQLGQCQIATELVHHKHLALRKITGVSLGLVASQLRVPALLRHAAAAHDHALRIRARAAANHAAATSAHHAATAAAAAAAASAAARTGNGSSSGLEAVPPPPPRPPLPPLPPPTLEECPNELVLAYIRGMWNHYRQAVEFKAIQSAAAAAAATGTSPATSPPPLRAHLPTHAGAGSPHGSLRSSRDHSTEPTRGPSPPGAPPQPQFMWPSNGGGPPLPPFNDGVPRPPPQQQQEHFTSPPRPHHHHQQQQQPSAPPRSASPCTPPGAPPPPLQVQPLPGHCGSSQSGPPHEVGGHHDSSRSGTHHRSSRMDRGGSADSRSGQDPAGPPPLPSNGFDRPCAATAAERLARAQVEAALPPHLIAAQEQSQSSSGPSSSPSSGRSATADSSSTGGGDGSGAFAWNERRAAEDSALQAQLTAISQLPFNEHEFWELQRLYLSPPPGGSSHSAVDIVAVAANSTPVSPLGSHRARWKKSSDSDSSDKGSFSGDDDDEDEEQRHAVAVAARGRAASTDAMALHPPPKRPRHRTSSSSLATAAGSGAHQDAVPEAVSSSAGGGAPLESEPPRARLYPALGAALQMLQDRRSDQRAQSELLKLLRQLQFLEASLLRSGNGSEVSRSSVAVPADVVARIEALALNRTAIGVALAVP